MGSMAVRGRGFNGRAEVGWSHEFWCGVEREVLENSRDYEV